MLDAHVALKGGKVEFCGVKRIQPHTVADEIKHIFGFLSQRRRCAKQAERKDNHNFSHITNCHLI